MTSIENKAAGTLVGLACGDAVGTTLEFIPKGSFTHITDMVGGGPFELPAGYWTDDTSMALCLAESLIRNHGFDAKDQISRYCNWWKHGYLSSTGICFDIGITVSSALEKFIATDEPYSGSTNKYSSGNGSIMRLAPIPIFYSQNIASCIKYAKDSSKTTHGSALCIDSCGWFSCLIFLALNGYSKQAMLSDCQYHPYTEEVLALSSWNFLDKDWSQLEGSGYVIESLEAALWCFFNTESFEEAILSAANLGNDADTTAAVCGQIAGAYYGLEGIPLAWQNRLYMRQEIIDYALQLLK